MRHQDDLDLPPLDGEAETDEALPFEPEALEVPADGEDALDDRTAEDEPLESFEAEGAESGWLEDDGEASGVDVGVFDLSLSAEEDVLADLEPDARADATDLGVALDEEVIVDGGEEGPTDDDEELREEDLPRLDADDGGEIDDEELFDKGALLESAGEELRWDDRAWERMDVSSGADEDAEDSGALAVPGDEPAHAMRDARWRLFDEAGRVTAAAFLPGDSVILAIDGPSGPLLVRIPPDGVARIVAEVEAKDADDPGEVEVTGLRWSARHGYVVVSGVFGVQVFRPA